MLEAGPRSITVQCSIHLKDPVTKAETGKARRAVEPQLVVEGGTSRVWVSASDCVQHGAHRCSLWNLSHQKSRDAAWGPLVDREHVHGEIELCTVPRLKPLKGLHLQLCDCCASGMSQIYGHGGLDHPIHWARWESGEAELGPALSSVVPPNPSTTSPLEAADTTPAFYSKVKTPIRPCPSRSPGSGLFSQVGKVTWGHLWTGHRGILVPSTLSLPSPLPME